MPLIERSLSMLLDLGIYEGDVFLEWIRERLEAKGVARSPTSSTPTTPTIPFRSRLQVVASDVTKHELLVLPRDAPSSGSSRTTSTSRSPCG